MEVGELEGGEPIVILSRNTYANNRPVVDKLLHSSLHQNGSVIYQSGGLLNTSKMYSDGGTYESNIDDQIREKRNRELDKKEEQKQKSETQNNAASTASDGNSPAAKTELVTHRLSQLPLLKIQNISVIWQKVRAIPLRN